MASQGKKFRGRHSMAPSQNLKGSSNEPKEKQRTVFTDSKPFNNNSHLVNHNNSRGASLSNGKDLPVINVDGPPEPETTDSKRNGKINGAVKRIVKENIESGQDNQNSPSTHVSLRKSVSTPLKTKPPISPRSQPNRQSSTVPDMGWLYSSSGGGHLALSPGPPPVIDLDPELLEALGLPVGDRDRLQRKRSLLPRIEMQDGSCL